ncbi:ABC-F type ribosomal protection protein [Brevibacillus sp. SYP-B805]|uniref:ribosomal protection-like ABC-F family protein n=1 Tax=Brevibacillus sp. SYP-B805 TaxID=1578199 RepID=UPI0013EB8764|nr:ABC-F type ribosomal protection protein [Brevibacillus sp. SYP-B805]NGQ93789.1 ABC-F type ribosomal protection protein [Brevibacillus sp. SYP-B805]
MLTLAFHAVHKSFGDHIVLQDVSFHLHKGEKAALVGANGAGKSTILKIALGACERDSGDILLAPHCEIGYLPQVVASHEKQTVEQLIRESQRELVALEKRLQALAATLQHLPASAAEAVLAEYGELLERFERRGGYEIEHRTAYVLQGLGLAHLPKDRRIATLSGGEKTRVGLAALLISSPDLLLLDEPSNHLDLTAIRWLESYLKSFQGALLFSSHDRRFVNEIATKIIEIDEHSHSVTVYPGNYDQYLSQKRKERAEWEERYERQQREIKQLKQRIKEKAYRVAHQRSPRDNDKFAPHFFEERVQATISRNIKAAEQALERILAAPVPKPPDPLQFRADFVPEELSSDSVLTVSGLCKTLDDGRPLLRDISFSLEANSRILIQGANGSGKTTLLNILAGKTVPDAGSVTLSPQVTIGYFEQEFSPADPAETLLDAFRKDLVGYREDHIALLLSYGLFRYEELQRKIGSVSPGQYRKLLLARLLASKANLLLIDEPTNHLSLDILEELESALDRFPGPIIVVSHDRWFRERFRGTVWQLADGMLQTG